MGPQERDELKEELENLGLSFEIDPQTEQYAVFKIEIQAEASGQYETLANEIAEIQDVSQANEKLNFVLSSMNDSEKAEFQEALEDVGLKFEKNSNNHKYHIEVNNGDINIGGTMIPATNEINEVFDMVSELVERGSMSHEGQADSSRNLNSQALNANQSRGGVEL